MAIRGEVRQRRADGPVPVPPNFRALPVLLRICANIDRLFVVEVGPFGRQLAEDARVAWLANGNKTKPSDVEDYVALLAQHIEDDERRSAFGSEARACIHL
ncbi:MAG: hypothetical protein ACREX7_04545 [Casimicrobiaceae bacterium]